MAKTVKVDLKRPYWDAKKRLYRPGRGVEMPTEDARKLKLVPTEQKASEPEGPNATPEAIELAKEYEIDLASVKGTGVDGRVTKPDVQSAVDALTDPNAGNASGSEGSNQAGNEDGSANQNAPGE